MAKNQQRRDMLDLLNKLLVIVLLLPFLFEVLLSTMIYLATLQGILSIDATNKTTFFYYVIFLSIPVIVAITLVRFLFIMKQKPNLSRIINEIVIVAGVFIFIWIFYIPHGGPSGIPPTQCTFPAGFACVSYKLTAQTGKLYLDIGQGTGHMIRVNGVACTQNSSPDYATTSFITYGGVNNITIASGSHTFLANPANAEAPWMNISCTDANGNLPSQTTIGTAYSGKIYINYTEMDTNITRIVIGTYATKYEA